MAVLGSVQSVKGSIGQSTDHLEPSAAVYRKSNPVWGSLR